MDHSDKVCTTIYLMLNYIESINTGDPLHSRALAHSRAPLFTQPCPIVHTAVPRENNDHGCVNLRCRAVCKLPGCVEGHPWSIDHIFDVHITCQCQTNQMFQIYRTSRCTWTREEDNWKCISIIGLLRYSIYIELPSQSPEHLYADNPNWSQIWVSVPRTNNWLCVCEHVIPLTNVAHYSRTKWTR